jgi:hypothetical protein
LKLAKLKVSTQQSPFSTVLLENWVVQAIELRTYLYVPVLSISLNNLLNPPSIIISPQLSPSPEG